MTMLSLSSPSSCDHSLDVAGGMRQAARRCTGKIGIVRTEQFLSRRMILGLDEPAPIADLDLERVVDLGPHEIVRRQIGVRRRRKTKIEKRVFERCLRSGDISYHDAREIRIDHRMMTIRVGKHANFERPFDRQFDHLVDSNHLGPRHGTRPSDSTPAPHHRSAPENRVQNLRG